jgi:ADP-heptose:LPS heptosyltransferase
MDTDTIRRVYEYVVGIGGSLVQIGDRPPYTGIGYNLVGYTGSILNTAALLQLSDLYIGNDSGLTHLCESVGGRCVTLYSSTNPDCYVHSDRQVAVCNSECYGCYNRLPNPEIVKDKCEYARKFHCINYASKTDKVIEAIRKVLG